VAASRMQISADFIHVACYWRSLGYNLYATGGHSGTIHMQLLLHAKPPVFASTLPEQLFESKNEDAIKKSEIS
jgi:hypothetical protein